MLILVPSCLAVPIFNIDKRPFALLCAYNGSNETKRYVRGIAFDALDVGLIGSTLAGRS